MFYLKKTLEDLSGIVLVFFKFFPVWHLPIHGHKPFYEFRVRPVCGQLDPSIGHHCVGVLSLLSTLCSDSSSSVI
jgi:hypothetical protein